MITHHTLKNGFTYIEVKNSASSAKIALQGAHIFEYKNSENLLWLSETSPFEIGKAVRGGIPLCWPSFGTNNPNLAQHGFARTTAFNLLDVDESQNLATQYRVTSVPTVVIEVNGTTVDRFIGAIPKSQILERLM